MSCRASLLLVGVVLSATFTFTRLVNAGSGGEGTNTILMVCADGPNAGLECANDADCPQSECVETTFLSDLFRCENGVNEGEICTKNADCIGGKCVLNLAKVPPFSAILTLIVDDYAHNFVDNDFCNRAATIILEAKGKRVAQTYLCLREDHFPELEFLRTEAGLKEAVENGVIPSILNRLLFRGAFVQPDDEPELQEDVLHFVQAMRELAGRPGHPIIESAVPLVVDTQQQIRLRDFSNYSGFDNKVASVLRLRVRIRFVIDPNL